MSQSGHSRRFWNARQCPLRGRVISEMPAVRFWRLRANESAPWIAQPTHRNIHPMRICIFGAGAVGSHFAVRLALSGHDVSCVMRGPHLEATKARGLMLRVGDAEFSARVRASDDPAALGKQDVVISTLKANGLGSLAAGLRLMVWKDT